MFGPMLALNRNLLQNNLPRADVLVATENPATADALAPNLPLRLAKVFKQEAL
jgi:hypothetical protein